MIEEILNEGPPPTVVSIHIHTILESAAKNFVGQQSAFRQTLESLTGEGLRVGNNEPYDGAFMGDTLDYTSRPRMAAIE